MKKNRTQKWGLIVKSNLKAGKLVSNHNRPRSGLTVKSNLKAGKLVANHNRVLLG